MINNTIINTINGHNNYIHIVNLELSKTNTS